MTARRDDDWRTARLAQGQALADSCSCGHPRKLHQDEYADQHFIGWGACGGWRWVDLGDPLPSLSDPCHCRAGDYPETAEDIGNKRDEGTW